MAPIYSTQLHNAAHVGAFNAVVYTVPAGATVVVTDVEVFYSASAAGQLLQVVLGAAIVLRHTAAAAELFVGQWAGKQVLNAGQPITFVNGGATSTVAITGYVLSP